MDVTRPYTTEPSIAASGQYVEPQILLVLIGLPGSGKTTFAEALVKNTTSNSAQPNGQAGRPWLRASQDDAPSKRRQECEARVRNGLKQGYNVIVDRVGFDAVQRSHFVNIADAHQPRPKVYALFLQVSIPTLEVRLGLRTSHPTLADPETAMRVLADMKRQLSIPRPEDGEGFDKIYTLPESRQPVNGEWTDEYCRAVLVSVDGEGEAETVPRRPIETRQAPRYPTRGRGVEHQYRGGYRGRGDFRGRGNGYSYRGNGSGPRGDGSYNGEGRSWRPPPVVPYRHQPNVASNADTEVRHSQYQPHPSSFQMSEPSRLSAATADSQYHP